MRSSILLLFVTLISIYSLIATEPVVTTYQNKNIVFKQFSNEIKAVFSSLDIQSTTYKDFQVLDTWYWKQEILNITNIHVDKLSLDISKINSNNLTEQNTVLLRGNIFNLTVGFDFSYKCYCKYQGKGSIVLQSSKMNFTKSYDTGSDGKVKTIAITVFDIIFDTGVLYDVPKIQNDAEILKMLNDGFKIAVNGDINEKVKILIYDQFKTYYNQTQDYKVNLTTTFPIEKLYFDVNTSAEPKNVKTQAVVYYMSSTLKPDNSTNTTELNKLERLNNGTGWDNFTDADGPYQVFISSSHLQTILSHITDKGVFNYDINDNDVPSDVFFKINIDALGEVYPSILNLLIYRYFNH